MAREHVQAAPHEDEQTQAEEAKEEAPSQHKDIALVGLAAHALWPLEVY